MTQSSTISFTIANPELVSKVIELVGNFSDLVNFQLNQNGLTVHAMDNTKVVLFELQLRVGKAIFYSNQQAPDKEYLFGINLKILGHATKGLKEDDELKMSFSTNDDSCLQVTVRKKFPLRVFQYKIAQFLTVDSETYEIEEFDKQVDVELLMKTSYFSQMIKELGAIGGDRIKIEVRQLGETSESPCSLVMKTSNEFIDAHIETQENNHLDGITINVKNNANRPLIVGNEYSCKLLSTITKASKISDQMLIQMSSDGPLGVLYALEDRVGSFQFFVAPFVDTTSDDED